MSASLDTFGGKRVTVMGLGRFGGGLGVTRWLAGQGAEVLVTDVADGGALADSVAALRDLIDDGCVRLRLGGHEMDDFTLADAVIANPAVPHPWDNPFLAGASDAGVPVHSEIGLLAERLPSRRVIGVTGSAGKSTTASLVHRAVAAVAPGAHLGGNLGGSLLAQLSDIGADDWVVLELSSAMLHWIDGWSPRIAVVTNIAPNHVDWHGSVGHYVESKRRITRWQREGDACVVASASGDLFADAPAALIVVPEETDEDWDLRMPGAHNRMNARLAMAAATAAFPEADRGLLRGAIEGFEGLPHRLKLVGEFDGVRFYDDSKSTTPGATCASVRAIEECVDRSRIRLIAGGYDKGLDVAPLTEIGRGCAGVYAIGATGGLVAACTGGRDFGTLAGAVDGAIGDARAGDVVLLSPGFASWDQFTNFEERGRCFLDLVRARFGQEART